ncbi:hypothetical protein Tco_1441128, partial [Tanacetum coccineum]
MDLPPRDQRNQYLRYEELQYTNADVGILRQAEEMQTAGFDLYWDPKLRLCHRLIACSIAGRSQAPEKVLEINFFRKEAEGYDILRSVSGPAWQERGTGGVAEEALVALRGDDEDEEMPQGQREVLDSMARDFSRFSTWTVTSLARLMDRASVPYMRYSESPVKYQRCTRQRTSEPSTSAALKQPDP